MNKAEKLFLLFFIVTANEMPEGGNQLWQIATNSSFAVAFLFLVLVGVIFVIADHYDEEDK